MAIRPGVEIQSVLINKRYFTLNEAIQWALGHNFSIHKVDISPKYYRFRQHDPSIYRKLRTKRMNEYITFIFGYQ